ncbi:MAG: cytochrome c [Verrucomicrobia bacterium]|nr:cytochrome c [Verrucomicrobiota bacterium]
MKIQTLLVITSMALSAGVASAADTAEIWAKNCASCHAKDGSGNTMMGKKSGVGNYTDAKVQAKFTDEEAAKVISEGKEKMKPFKDKLTPEEIKALVAHIRAFKK